MESPFKTSHMIRGDELLKSQFVTISGRPCRITSITFSRTSHNTPTLHIRGIDITTALKPLSFIRNPQQVYSLYTAPRAMVPVPGVTCIRADRLKIGDYVSSPELQGYVTDMEFVKAGERQKVYVLAEETVTGVQTRGRLWDDELISIPELHKAEFRLVSFVETQIIEIVREDVNIVHIGCSELSHRVEMFWACGLREVWVTLMKGGVVGAFEVRELEVLGLHGDDYLALRGEGRISDMIVKKPMGVKGDEIDGLLKNGSRFKVKIRADMGQEEKLEAWVVADMKSL